MNSRHSGTNRRVLPRIRCRGCSFIADVRFGRVIDLSLGGAAIYYADREPWTETTFRGATLRFDAHHFVDNLSLQTISDQAVLNYYAPGAMNVRRRSVRFVALSSKQQQQLTELIIKSAHGRKRLKPETLVGARR